MAGGGGSGAFGGFGAVPTTVKTSYYGQRIRLDFVVAVINARKRTVTPRHIILGIASLAVLAMALYLFNEVRTTTASSAVPERTAPTPTASTNDTPKAEEPEPSKVASRPANLPVRAPPPETRETPQPIVPSSGGDVESKPVNVADELSKPNPKMDAVMAEANKAYDRGDFDEAKGIALKVIAKDPANTRMLRIIVSANCIDGDSAEAQKHYLSLPPGDREQMKVRCARYGVSFNDK